MTKVLSRFLAVLMLAVLAFTDVTTTPAFGRGGFSFRPTPHVHDVLKPNFDPLRLNRVENPGAMIREYSREQIDDLDAPEKKSQSGGGLRPYPHPDPVLQ